MTMLVSLDEAKDQLRIMRDNVYFDNDVELKTMIASDIILDFLKLDAPPDSWYDDDSPSNLDTPPLIKGYTLIVMAELYQNRESSISQPLSAAVKDGLRRYRDPALA